MIISKRLRNFTLATACLTCLSGLPATAAPGNSCTGKINHTTYTKGERGTCSVTSLPTNLAELKSLQAQVASEPQGAVLCFLAAMNIYVKDEAEGRACLELTSYKIGASEFSLLKSKLRGPDSDTYVQKYLPLAGFKGATPENGYTPDKPYTVEVSVNNGRPYSVLTDANAPVIYLNYNTKGTDMGTRPVSVIKPEGTPYFVVYDRAGMMLQVKNSRRK